MIENDPKQNLQNLREAGLRTGIEEISLEKYARQSAGRNSDHQFVSPSNVLITQEVRRLNTWEFSAAALHRLDALVSSLPPHKRAVSIPPFFKQFLFNQQ